MSGLNHYAEAEKLLNLVDPVGDDPHAATLLAAAQVHATLALAGATALSAVTVRSASANTGQWSVITR